MPSKKQEIRKQVKKKLKKEGMEHQELNQEAEIVDLGDRRGDDIIVESFDDIKTDAKPLPFSTTPQKSVISTNSTPSSFKRSLVRLAYFTASGALKILLLVGANPILTDFIFNSSI